MSMARYVNVVCDGCGTPAGQPCWNGAEARKEVPSSWTRVPDPRGRRRRIDLCPECQETLATDP